MRKIFGYCLIFLFSFLLINNVYAQNIELKVKKVDNVKLLTRDGRYDSAQAMTVTNKYIVVVLASSDSSITNNVIYVYDKNTYKFIMRKEITSCSHANGITYNKDNNTLVCADAHNKRFVVYDASNFSFKKFVYTNQPYNNIDYDSSRKNYWVVIDSNFAPKWYKIIRFDENFNRIAGGDIAYDTLESYGFESSQKYRVNQDIVYKDNYLYLLNFINSDNLHFYKPGFSNVQLYDSIILSYDVRTGKKGNLLFYHPTDEINELEDIAFDGEKPYFLYQRGGRFQLYTADYTPRNVNAKVNVSVNSNNSSLLKDAGFSANFVSNSSNFNLNKSVNYNNGYTLSNLYLNKVGRYELKITQNNKNLSNWTIDNSTLYAYIDVKYNLNINNIIYNVSFKDKKGSFTNTFTYSKINVPLEIAAPVAYSNQVSYNLDLKASLYKDNKKISQVAIKNGKYLFNDLNFANPGVYNYVIKQDNSGTKTDGIYTSYIDDSEIKVKITVTASGDQLKYKVEYDKIKSFSNKVTVKYNTVENNFEIPIVTNRSNNDISIPKTKLKIYKDGKALKTVDSNNNKYTFSIAINSPGLYKYKLVQEDIQDSDIYKYSIDKSEVYLEITAKVVGNKLVCSNNFVKRSYINKISIVYPELTIPISLKINSNVSGNIVVPETTAVISGSGFSDEIKSKNGYYKYNVKINKEGQYAYSIYQKNINSSDYQYNIDNNKIIATVNVSASGDHLNYSINYSRTEFSNSYEEYDLVNLKFLVPINTVKNEQNVETASTTAYLYDSNNVLLMTTSSDNLYEFDNISVSGVGNYQYRIVQKEEIINLSSGIDYVLDNKEIIVNVIVTNQNGNLRAKINYSDDGFTNTINVNYSEVVARPKIDVMSVMNDGVIRNIEEKASIYTSDGNTKIATVNVSNNAYTFNIPISQPGDYEYIIKQDNSGIYENNDNITFIDDDIKRVTINCVYEGNTLNTNINYNLDNQLFTNYFLSKENVLNIPLQFDINNNVSNQRINIPTTTAVLSILNDDGVYEEIETENSDDGSYKFNNIYIVDEGIYIYKVSQDNSGKSKNGIYDYYISDKDKIIIVEVSKDQSGNLNYTIMGDYNSFENSYEIIYDPITIPFTINISDNSFNLLNTLPNRLIIANDVQVIDSIIINSPIITSNKVQINKEGEYKFNIFQTKPYNYIRNNFSHSFDSRIIEATVNVTADDNNKLSYNISYGDLNVNTFNNAHTPVDSIESDIINIPIDIDIFTNSKEIENLNMMATLFEDGLPFETVINTNNKYSFTGINIVSPGDYVYTIKQVPISFDDWNIDDEIITVNVEVYTDDDGHLKYNLSYVDDISSFTNNDLTIVLDGSDDLSVASSDDEVLDDVPSTSLFKGKLLIIVGFILVAIGYGVISFYKSLVKKNIKQK